MSPRRRNAARRGVFKQGIQKGSFAYRESSRLLYSYNNKTAEAKTSAVFLYILRLVAVASRALWEASARSLSGCFLKGISAEGGRDRLRLRGEPNRLSRQAVPAHLRWFLSLRSDSIGSGYGVFKQIFSLRTLPPRMSPRRRNAARRGVFKQGIQKGSFAYRESSRLLYSYNNKTAEAKTSAAFLYILRLAHLRRFLSLRSDSIGSGYGVLSRYFP